MKGKDITNGGYVHGLLAIVNTADGDIYYIKPIDSYYPWDTFACHTEVDPSTIAFYNK